MGGGREGFGGRAGRAGASVSKNALRSGKRRPLESTLVSLCVVNVVNTDVSGDVFDEKDG